MRRRERETEGEKCAREMEREGNWRYREDIKRGMGDTYRNRDIVRKYIEEED